MRHRRDHLGKDLLDLLLSRWGTLRTEVPVPATDAQRADVSFVPRAELPPSLGLLARLGAVPCIFELFSEGPSREELLACQRKLLQWRHALRKRHRDAEPMCWLLCAERPTLALHALGFAADGETPGIYRNAYGLRVIVIDELPRTGDTVLLRLLGRDATREGAIDALPSLPLTPDRLDEIVGLFVHYATLSAPTEDPTMAVDLSRYYAWKEQQRAEGRLEGRLEGEAKRVGASKGRPTVACSGALRPVCAACSPTRSSPASADASPAMDATPCISAPSRSTTASSRDGSPASAYEPTEVILMGARLSGSRAAGSPSRSARAPRRCRRRARRRHPSRPRSRPPRGAARGGPPPARAGASRLAD